MLHKRGEEEHGKVEGKKEEVTKKEAIPEIEMVGIQKSCGIVHSYFVCNKLDIYLLCV